MDFTGERYLPTLDSPEISYEHWHRYFYASHFVNGKTVLDIACGEGYGSYLLAQSAQHVVGIDLDSDSINHAASTYVRSNLEFKVGSTHSIPVEGESIFDGVVSFETIEHISEAEQEIFLNDVKRLLKPDGFFLISTPNKLVYSDIPGYKNEFHIKEFYIQEFQAFLKRFFKHVKLLGQKIYPVSYIWDSDTNQTKMAEYRLTESHTGFSPTDGPKTILYLVAWCSDVQTEDLPSSVLVDISEKFMRVRHQQFASLEMQVAEHERQVGALNAEVMEKQQVLEHERDQFRAEQERLAQQVAERDQELAQIQESQAALQVEVNRSQAQVGALSAEVMEKQQTLEHERTLFKAEKERLAQQIAERDQGLAQMQESQTALQAEVTRFRTEVTGLSAQVTEKQQALEQKAEQLAQLVAEREQLAKQTQAIEVAMEEEVQRLQTSVIEKEQELCALKGSESYRFGLLLSWPLRKTWAITQRTLGHTDRPRAYYPQNERAGRVQQLKLESGSAQAHPSRDQMGERADKKKVQASADGTVLTAKGLGIAQRLDLDDNSDENSCETWLRHHGTLTDENRQIVRHHIDMLNDLPLISTIAGGDLTTWREMSFTSAASYLLESLEVSRLPSPDEMAQRYLEPLAELWAEHLAHRASAHIDEWAFGTLPANPRRSIIVPLYGRYDFLLHQVHHFCRDRDFDETDLIYVVDDPAIIDGVMQLATTISTQYTLGFRVVYAGANYGYAAANNLGAMYAQAPLLVLLNSDVFPVEKGWLSRLETVHASLPIVGALGVRLLFEDRSIQHAGLTFRRDASFPGVWLNDHPGKGLPEALVPSRGTVPVSAVTGACLMIGTELYREVGGLDEGYMLGDFEDSDLCLTLLSRGYVNYLADDIVLYHLERQSQGIGFDATWKFKLTLCNAFRHTARWDALIRKLEGNT